MNMPFVRFCLTTTVRPTAEFFDEVLQMNYSQPEDFEPRETDREADEPTHYTKVWNSSMLWEVGLILLVALVLIFCALYFSAHGGEVAEIAGANRGMTWELSIEMIEPSGKIDVDRVPITNSPFDSSFCAAKQSGIDTEFGREGLEAFTQTKIINMAK
jgi:hypothetical protein